MNSKPIRIPGPEHPITITPTKGRVAVVDYEARQGPHPDQPDLQVSREQLAALTKTAGLTQVEEVKLFPTKYFLVFARQ